jgi:deoxyribonuclease-4
MEYMNSSLIWSAGTHLPFAQNIYNTLSLAANTGMYTVQFFMGNPKTFTRSKISKDDIKKCQELLSNFPMNVFTHFPYTASLCGRVAQLAWQGTEQDTKTEKMLEQLEYEIATVASLKPLSCGVVVHPGSFKKKEAGLQAISESINRMKFPPGGRLILENCAGEGTKLCVSLQDIKTVLDGVDEKHQPHVGVCIDTCHIYASGEYNLSECDEVQRLFDDFEEIIGMKKFSLLHLNDSKLNFHCCADRHAHLGTGSIWGKDLSSLVFLLDLCEKNKIPIVCETSIREMEFLAILGKIKNNLNDNTDLLKRIEVVDEEISL